MPRKVFISYHHANDQAYKNYLSDMADKTGCFMDKSVFARDIDDSLNDQQIRRIIRDRFLQDSTVTILLAGTETKKRKHVDWELYSSMYDGAVNKQSGILVLTLPSTGCTSYWAVSGSEQVQIYPEQQSWTHYTKRLDFEQIYPHLPARIIDNLVSGVPISVVPWEKVFNNPPALKFLIEQTFQNRARCNYDLRRRMRRHNS